MYNITSGNTLALKFFIPTLWVVFFGTITLFALLSENAVQMFGGDGGIFGPKMALTFFFLSGVALFYFLFMRLKRVEIDEEYVYVTNYLKIYKYPYSNIEKVERKNVMLFRPTTIYFKVPGSFGNQITFLEGRNFDRLMKQEPELVARFLQLDS